MNNGDSANGSDLGLIKFHIQGTSPMIQHSGRLANPLDPLAKEIKTITGKRKKTDDDHLRIMDLEWEGGLYTNGAGQVIVPGRVLAGAFVEAGKKSRRGADVRSALFVDGDPQLIFPASRTSTLDELRADPNHRLVARVGLNGKTIVRTRPRFPTWDLKFTINYFKSIFDSRDVISICEVLGKYVGLSDDRVVGGGRFEVIEAIADES